MAMTAVWLNIDGAHLGETLQQAADKLDSAEGELVLDFSSVARVDANALKTLEQLAGLAQQKGVKLALRGINVEIYKVLKLIKLTSRFAFVN